MTSPPVPLGPFYGAMYFSAIISTAFYGMICMQTFIYYIRYQNDPFRLKGFVALLWALNTTHQAMTISGSYKYIRAGLESPTGFLYSIPDLFLAVLPTILVSLFTQGFFVYRIYIFSEKNIIVPLIWVPLAIYQFVADLLYVVKALYITSSGIQAVGIATLGDTFYKDITISYCSVAAGVDVFIAISMVVLLSRKRSRTGYKSTSKLLHRLGVLAIMSGIWTAVFALLSAIMIYVFPSNLIWIVFSVPLCSLYCNTLLANLNARAYIRGQIQHHTTADIMLSGQTRILDADTRVRDSQLNSQTDLGIWKTTEVVTLSDANGSQKV